MSYTPNIPQAGDNPSQSQPLILSNFQQLNTQFGTNLSTGTGGDHTLLTSVSNNGKHNRVTLLDQSAAISAVKQAGVAQVLIYGKTNSGVTMPYYTRDNLTTEFSLSPIKAYASFTSIAANTVQNITPDDSFNVNTPIVQTPGGILGIPPTTFTVTMTNACRTMVYGVIAYANLGALPIRFSLGYTITNASTFVITFPYAPGGSPGPVTVPAIRWTVIVLET